jgi:hypothetical protein
MVLTINSDRFPKQQMSWKLKYDFVRFDVLTAFVVWWSEFLATDLEVVGSIPGASRFSEKQRVWNGVYSASWGQLRS